MLNYLSEDVLVLAQLRSGEEVSDHAQVQHHGADRHADTVPGLQRSSDRVIHENHRYSGQPADAPTNAWLKKLCYAANMVQNVVVKCDFIRV